MTKEKLLKDFLEFAGAANKRSTVDLKDGLKPVHRRILYTLNDYKSGFTGSNKVVGDTLGMYHPAGDSSIYDAAVRLAQPFKTRYPLVDFDGSRGTVADPTGYAASRYTKMKLSNLGKEVLTDINKGTVPFVENYDGTLMEPVYTPGLVPVTLINGAISIGVGMASSIPPHNLREVARAVEYLIDNPAADVKSLMRFIKGPDFPTGGTIGNPEALLEAYETGSGAVRIQADYELKTIGGQTHIIIKEVPFLVDPNTKIIAPLKEMYEEGYEYIEDIQIQTGKGIPFQLDITLTKDAPVFAVVEKILKETSIESSFGINFTTHVGENKFQRQNLKGLLRSYIDQNIVRVVKSAQFDLGKAEARLLIVEALIKAQAQIEEVVKIIRTSSDTTAARQGLMKLLVVNETQVNAILAMRLSQLTKLDVDKLKNEKTALLETIKTLKTFISDKDLQLEKIKEDIKELARKYGDGRRTRIHETVETGTVQDITIFLTTNNEIYAQPTSSLESNNRNTKGRKGEDIISVLETKSNGLVWVATEEGMVYPVEAAKLMVSEDIIKNTVDNLGVRGKAVHLSTPLNKENLITVTKEGTIKRSAMSEYKRGRAFRACKMRKGETLEKLIMVDDNEGLIIVNKSGLFNKIDTTEISSTGVNTIGTKLNDALSVTAATDRVLFVGKDGYGKQVDTTSLRSVGRRSAGSNANNAVTALSINGSHVYIMGEEGHTIRLAADKITVNKAVSSKGVILYNGKISRILT